MSVTVELEAELLARLEAEAARRGVKIDTVIAEFAAQLPADTDDALAAFIGSGASGRGDLGRRHREIRAEQTSGMTARDF